MLLKPDGSPYAEGDTVRFHDLANTYRAIADGGIDYFYRGPFADALDHWMKDNGGILRREDFAGYQMKLREPLVTRYHEYTIVGFPPPSSGGVHVAQILNILEHFDLRSLEQKDPADEITVVADAMKLAFADRAYWLGDPDFVRVPRGLVDPAYGALLAARVSPDRAIDVPTHGDPPEVNENVFGKHTTHIAAADAAGNWVALTCTLNTSFGSKVIIPGTGVILNNQMDDFSIEPGVANHFKLVGAEANAVAPGKRPLSSMSPTIILKDNQPIMTVGAAGGPKIITQVLLVILAHLDLNDSLEAALARRDFIINGRRTSFGLRIRSRRRFAIVWRRGFKLDVNHPVGATQAIERDSDGFFTGVSEPRLPGKAAGPDLPSHP